MGDTIDTEVEDVGIAEFIGMARSANVYFEIVNDRLTVRAVNPNWTMWAPIRHFLDEIGVNKIEGHVRRAAGVATISNQA